MPRAKSVGSLIKDLEPDELRTVVLELCKLSPKNKRFVELYLLGSDEVDVEAVVAEAKQKILGCFFSPRGFPREQFDLRRARAVLSEHQKLLKDYPQRAADLKLYYVETGTRVTDTYGDMYEAFYNSLASVFRQFCKDISRHPSWYGAFEQRIEVLRRTTGRMGWGYGDEIEWQIGELKAAVEKAEGQGEDEG